MKKILLGLSLSLLASAASGQEANVETVVADAPGFNWTGAYVGAHAGYVWQDITFMSDITAKPGGLLGGVYAGYNFQLPSNIVLGVEADLGRGDLSFNPAELGFTDYTAVDTQLNGHVRARLGYAVDRALFYVAGGASLARVALDDTDPGYDGDSDTYLGWSIGAGVDYAMTDNLILRAEYLYDDYGTEMFDVNQNGVPSYGNDLELTASTLRLGVAWKF